MSKPKSLRAPFPWFGGKSKVAHLIWERFGDVPNYVEPFAGSMAAVLGRPHWPWDGNRIETVNDADCFLSNFWRAIKEAPAEVAQYADSPVNEADLHARHLWLMNTARERIEQLRTDPDFYDVKVAGWWVWGLCAWIGSGWCSVKSSWGQPFADGRLAHEKRPHLGNAGKGVHRPSQQIPHLGDAGRGVHRPMGDAGRGDNKLVDYFFAISNRLRYVRVCCGDWARVCGPSPTVKQGLTGVFLDPPYSFEASRDMGIYAVDCGSVAHAVREWAIAHGDDKKMRICLAGYEGEHAMPANWNMVVWKAHGGYGSQGSGKTTKGRDNSRRERLWFSPHCLSGRRAQREMEFGA